MTRKNFIARIETNVGVVYECTPRRTSGEVKRWILRMIKEDCPSILAYGIHSIKIFHTPTRSYQPVCYLEPKKELYLWAPMYVMD